jgi:uncharacterized protein (DUF2126 family)
MALAGACLAQVGTGLRPPAMGPIEYALLQRPEPNKDVTLPNGKSQKDEIAKSEHAQNVRDAQELARLSRQLRDSLARSDAYVLSLDDLKKIDDIEKLAKKIRGRLRHN